MKQSDEVFSFGTFTKEEASEILSHYDTKPSSASPVPVGEPEEDKLISEIEKEFETLELSKEIEWDPSVDLVSYFELINGDRLDLGTEALLAGIFNKGTTCYVNSIVQTLMRCPPFQRVLSMISSIVEGNEGHHFIAQFPLLFQVHQAYVALKDWKRTQSIAPAVDIMSLLETINQYDSKSEFYGRTLGTQHDAQEFLQWLLDALDEEQNKVACLNEEPAHDEADEWQEVAKGGKRGEAVVKVGDSTDHARTSIISRLFSGTLRSSLQKSGAKANIVAQSFRSLQLDIQSKQVRSVSDALELYFSPEFLDSGGLTNRKVGQMVVLLDVLPTVLVLHLKRFNYNPHTGGAEKVGKPVSFPETLRLSPHWLSPRLRKEQEIQAKTSSSSNQQYQLFSTVYHQGKNLQAGHYTATIKDPVSNKWHHFDDQKVTQAKCPIAYPEEVYLLFYALR